MDDLFLTCLPSIAPEDQEAFRQSFFRSYQLKAAECGKKSFRLTYRRCTREGVWHWVESTALVYTSPHNDEILSFIVSRSMDEEKAQEDLRHRLLTDHLTGLYSREGFFEKAQEMIGEETGVNEYITKPFELDTIVKKVEEYLGDK